jgi:D-glycero-D-manno-heptose 1,7-bisphosphate phosphatase
MPTQPKAAFLDRDGTLIFDPGYLADPDGVRLLPGVPEALRRLRDADFLLVIVSNQSGIARGLYTADDLARVHARLVELLAQEGIAFAAAEYCQHGPEDACSCRKPAPGMILAAAAALDIDLPGSAMVGDKVADVLAGLAAGCGRNVLLASRAPDNLPPGVDVRPDLPSAVGLLLPPAA